MIVIGKLIDLTGQQFGKLTVLYQTDKYTSKGQKITYWHCKCECGTECDIRSSSLRNGTRTSCGCEGIRRFQGDNLTGNKYGRVQVISLNKENKNGTYWNCKCECGNYFVAKAEKLKKNKIIYCNECINKMNDLTGQKFGKLLVKEKDGKRWVCECECGTRCLRTRDVLLSGKSTSCGCDRTKKSSYGRDIIGKKFGKLLVIQDDVERNTKHKRYLICQCECGNNVSVRMDSLTTGTIVSCGCYHRELLKNTHNTKMNDVVFKDNTILIKSSTDDTDFIIDADDYNKVKKYCWHSKAGYAYAPSRGDYNVEQISMARLIMNCIDKDEIEVDHINHDTTDNRKCNLRLATSNKNNWNREQSHGNIQYNAGSDSWDVIIFYKLQKIKLGSYKDRKMALDIRYKAEKVFYGDFQYKEEKNSEK